MDRPQTQLERLLIEQLNRLSAQQAQQLQLLAEQQQLQAEQLNELSQQVVRLTALLKG